MKASAYLYIHSYLTRHSPESFRVSEKRGEAYNDDRYYPRAFEVIVEGDLINYELADARVYKQNSWALYEKKQPRFNIDQL